MISVQWSFKDIRILFTHVDLPKNMCIIMVPVAPLLYDSVLGRNHQVYLYGYGSQAATFSDFLPSTQEQYRTLHIVCLLWSNVSISKMLCTSCGLYESLRTSETLKDRSSYFPTISFSLSVFNNFSIWLWIDIIILLSSACCILHYSLLRIRRSPNIAWCSFEAFVIIA